MRSVKGKQGHHTSEGVASRPTWHLGLLWAIAASAILVPTLSGICCGRLFQSPLRSETIARKAQTISPFDGYPNVADQIFAYDRALFTPYVGAPLVPFTLNPTDGVHERIRLGTAVVAPGVKLDIEVVSEPMSQNYEFFDSKSRRLVHKFTYFYSRVAPLLISGQGFVFDYTPVQPLCGGRATRKHKFVNGRFVEVQQALLLLNDAQTEIVADVQLRASASLSSSPVASLPSGSTATVLAHESPNRYLLKTPLGLTGWIVDDGNPAKLSILHCN